MVCVGTVAYHMLQVVHPLQGPQLHENSHLMLGLVIIYLGALAENRRRWYVLLPLLGLSVAATTYIHINFADLEFRQGFPTLLDSVFGIVLIIIVLDACGRAMGWAIPLMSVLCLAYALLGQYVSPPLNAPELSFLEVVAISTTNLTGIYGRLLAVSAIFIFLFVIMGGIIQVTAASRFFSAVGNLAARTMRGGPAMSAVVTSGLLGSTIGSASANVAVTGVFTIPLMKKMGYRPFEAAAIESAASNGGQIMPPVMGSVAFLMSEFTGIPYFTIAVASLLPALFYFLSVGIYVQLIAMKRDFHPVQVEFGWPQIRELLTTAPAFLLPIIVIVALFLRGFSPMFVAFWAVVTCFVLGLVTPGKKPSLREWIQGITSSARSAATIAISLAAVGLVVEMLIQTGLAIQLPGLVESWSRGNLPLALVLVAVSSIILGMGMPTASAYIIVAIAAAPVLVRMGLPLLPAHLFVLYFATISLITPPVAGGVVVACRLAGSGYLRTALEATKVAIAGFLGPFIFVTTPIFLLQPGGELVQGIVKIIAGLIMVLCTQITFVNHYLTSVQPFHRALFALCAVSLFVYIVAFSHFAVLLVSGTLFAWLTFSQMHHRRIYPAEPPLM